MELYWGLGDRVMRIPSNTKRNAALVDRTEAYGPDVVSDYAIDFYENG